MLTALSAAELAAYRRIQANPDGSDGDVLPEIVDAVVMEARGRIAACKTNTLADGVTLPEVMVHHVAVIVRYRLLSRLGLNVKSVRENEYRDARAFLADVSRCLVAIPDPAGSDDTQQHWPKPSFTTRKQQFDRRSQDGI